MLLKVTDSSDSRTCKSSWPRWCIGCSIWHCHPDDQGLHRDADLYAECWIASYNKLQIYKSAGRWEMLMVRNICKKCRHCVKFDTSWDNWHVEAWTSIFRLDATVHERASWREKLLVAFGYGMWVDVSIGNIDCLRWDEFRLRSEAICFTISRNSAWSASTAAQQMFRINESTNLWQISKERDVDLLEEFVVFR